MKVSNVLHALVARKKKKDFNKRLNCSIVNGYVALKRQLRTERNVDTESE